VSLREARETSDEAIPFLKQIIWGLPRPD